MPVIAEKSTTTVRQRSPWRMSLVVGLIVFVAVTGVGYGWKFRQVPLPQPTAPLVATARVSIHHPAFAWQTAWQLIQSKSEVRDHLTISSDNRGGSTIASISLSDLPRETIVAMVNIVASAFAENCRSQWKVEVEQAYSAAQERVREARHSVQAADARLDLLRQRQEQASAAGSITVPSAPTMIENPQWTEATRRLAELEEKRRVLLFERTPLHPSVQEVEMRISEARRELTTIPARISQAATGVQRLLLPPPVAPEELATAEQLGASARSQLVQAESSARAALAMRSGNLEIDIEPADTPPPAAVPQQFSATLLGAVAIAAAAFTIGLGMVTIGASLEPLLSGIGELQSLLPVPVIGVVPAVHPSQPGRSNTRRKFVRYTSVFSGSVLLFAAGWFLFRI